MDKDAKRLHSLDGLRGLAMLFVFLNHLTPKYLIAAFPILDQLGLFSSGIAGVSFFFILSGFLMSYLYPMPQNKFKFLQKRYTRIFPLFLTMCTVMLTFSLYPTLPWFERIGFILILALFVNALWMHVIKKISLPHFSQILFFAFLFLQIGIGGFYLLWVMRQPPIVLQHFSPVFANGLVGLVNATLTFPLGNYIPMLDGVYWSLAAEILFYILYPFIIVPLVLLLATQKKVVKILFLLTLLPFFGGVDILSRHLFSLSTLQFSLFYYFAFGILLGHLYLKKPQVFSRFSQIFTGPLTYAPILLLVILFVGEHLLSAILPSSFSPWIRLFSAFPFALIVAIALNRQTSLYKLLSTKVLVFIGTISYSLYLSHAAVIHMAEDFHRSGSLPEDIYTIIFTLIISIAISSVLYFLLERPYFHRPQAKAAQVKPAATKLISFTWSKSILVGVSLIYLFAIFLSFQSNFNLFSIITPQSPSAFSTLPTNNTISLRDHPIITVKIPATENNLGIIVLSVTHYKSTSITDDNPSFFFTLQEQGTTKPFVTIPYVLDEFRGVDFPFGFPTITNSKGKTYIATFALVPPSTGNYATLDTASLKTVYQIDKNMLLKNPSTAAHVLLNKMQNVFSNQLSLITFLLLLPFLGLGISLILYPTKLVRFDWMFEKK